MINKQGLWFLTLFSLILVLSVYYITMPEDFTNKESTNVSKITKKQIKENEVISTLKVENEEERDKKIKELQTILTKDDATSEEKNNAYEELKNINLIKGKEENLSKTIKKEYKVDNFVQIKEDQVRIVIIKKEHDVKLANEIMNMVQQNFNDKVFITVKFQK